MYLHIYTLCSQFLGSQDYTNCIRTEDGFCGIEWKEKSGTSNGECITILLIFPHFKSKKLLVPSECVTILLIFPHFKSKKLLVPCFELSPPDAFYLFGGTSAIAAVACPTMSIYIPNLR